MMESSGLFSLVSNTNWTRYPFLASLGVKMNLCSRVVTVAVSFTVSHSQTWGLLGQAATVWPIRGELVAVNRRVCRFEGRAEKMVDSCSSKPPGQSKDMKVHLKK